MSATNTGKEFWVSSGHHMTRRTESGGLAITEEMILAYLARPELVPPPEACAAERELHAALLRAPLQKVEQSRIAAIADADARENWQFMLGFRDRLTAHDSVEAAYLAIIREGARGIPPLFLNQLVHLILRNALDGCDDPYILRAAELIFRPQKASLREGTLLLADAELVEEFEAERQGLMHSAPLAAMLAGEAGSEIEVLNEATAPSYWSRSDAFAMALNFGGDPKARGAFAEVIAVWLKHLLGVSVKVAPIAAIEDADWRWFVGLDAEATAIGNRLWRGEPVAPGEQGRVCGLFRLDFTDRRDARPEMAGKPAYLIMALDEAMILRVKPQNLIAGLPLAARTS